MNKARVRTAAVLIVVLLVFVGVWLMLRLGGGLLVPVPPEYGPGVGLTYSKDLAEATQKLSLVLLIFGWILVVCGALLAIAASVLGSRKVQDGKDGLVEVLRAHRGLIASALAIVSAGTGWQLMDRSSAATMTASVATQAIAAAAQADSLSDWRAYTASVQAKASWMVGRMSQDRLGVIVDQLSGSSGSPPRAPAIPGPADPDTSGGR